MNCLENLEQPLQHNLRTFNKTDSLWNIERWLKELYNIELKNIISSESYQILNFNNLILN